MKHNTFSFSERTRGYSVMISPSLMFNLLACFDNFFFSSERSVTFKHIFKSVISEFRNKLYYSVLQKVIGDKNIKGVKIIFYYDKD